MKNYIALFGIIVLIAAVVYFVFIRQANILDVSVDTQDGVVNTIITPKAPVATSTLLDVDEATVEEFPTKTLLGQSASGNDIIAYHFGTGNREVLLIGGIHGGYSWNTALLGFELVKYFETTPTAVPEGVRVTVVPVLNPDGLETVVGTTESFAASSVPTDTNATIPGRFNGNTVDLNRNFDCDWQASGVWQNRTVSGGSAAFSEPESRAIRKYIDEHDIAGAVVWYSAAGGVYASNCRNGILPETSTMMNLYAQASGYPAFDKFDFYAITGDMVNWLAKEKIPAISVLLTSHRDMEWTKNRTGVDALLKYFAD